MRCGRGRTPRRSRSPCPPQRRNGMRGHGSVRGPRPVAHGRDLVEPERVGAQLVDWLALLVEQHEVEPVASGTAGVGHPYGPASGVVGALGLEDRGLLPVELCRDGAPVRDVIQRPHEREAPAFDALEAHSNRELETRLTPLGGTQAAQRLPGVAQVVGERHVLPAEATFQQPRVDLRRRRRIELVADPVGQRGQVHEQPDRGDDDRKREPAHPAAPGPLRGLRLGLGGHLCRTRSTPRTVSRRSTLARSFPAPPISRSRPVPPESMSRSLPPSSRSRPAPPERSSLPLPPFRTSSPALPRRSSAPAPPISTSLPPPPISTSSPPPPHSTSALPVPRRTSARSVPVAVQRVEAVAGF